jgi:hypothetical protein
MKDRIVAQILTFLKYRFIPSEEITNQEGIM